MVDGVQLKVARAKIKGTVVGHAEFSCFVSNFVERFNLIYCENTLRIINVDKQTITIRGSYENEICS